jgi:TolA-binding protein
MRQAQKVALIGAILFITASGHGQSLGDVARKQRQKQAKDAKDGRATRKVLTNEDLPAATELASTTSISTGQHNTAPASPASNDTRAGERWKAMIETQKNSIASLQSQIDQVNSSIHFASGTCVANCAQWNEQQIKKQDDVQRLQQRLEQQKKQLENMQESARKAGLGSSVYEP